MKKLLLTTGIVLFTIMICVYSCFAQQAGVGLSQQLPMHGHGSRLDGGNLAMTGETSATGATFDLGTVTAGDRIYVEWHVMAVQSSGVSQIKADITKTGGSTATIQTYADGGGNSRAIFSPTVSLSAALDGAGHYPITMRGVIKVTGNGTLTLGSSKAAVGTAPTFSNEQWYGYFRVRQ